MNNVNVYVYNTIKAMTIFGVRVLFPVRKIRLHRIVLSHIFRIQMILIKIRFVL